MAEARNPSNETQNPKGPNTSVVQNQPQRSGLSSQRDFEELNSPFTFMRRFMSDMDRLFGDFGFGAMRPPLAPGFERSGGAAMWSPQIDISERNGQIMIQADLPGLRQEDIRVNVEDGVLTIAGERSDEHEQNQGGVHRRERSYGSFVRRVALPEGVDADSIKASFENGVLEVSMSAPQRGSQGRQIPVQNKGSQGAPPNMSH
jgi:HSP20 family protein